MDVTEASGAGQEQYRAELGDLLDKIRGQEKEIEGLRARLSGVTDAIHETYSNVFEVEKSPTKY